MGHLDEAIQGRQIAGLLLLREARHAHIREAFDMEEVRVCGREVPGVLVAEDEHEGVEAVAGQRVEVGGPVRLVEEAGLERGLVHGVDGERPLRDGGLGAGGLTARSRHGPEQDARAPGNAVVRKLYELRDMLVPKGGVEPPPGVILTGF